MNNEEHISSCGFGALAPDERTRLDEAISEGIVMQARRLGVALHKQNPPPLMRLDQIAIASQRILESQNLPFILEEIQNFAERETLIEPSLPCLRSVLTSKSGLEV